MALSENTKDILSFGAHSRVQNKAAEYDEARSDLLAAQQLERANMDKVNASLAALLATRKSALAALGEIRQLAEHFSVRDRNLAGLQVTAEIGLALEHVEATLSGAEIAQNTLQGVTTGGGAVLGAWALSAATGGSLTAATTAGLAAGLGLAPAAIPGAAAATGLAGGAAVLGGLVVIPAAAAVAAVSHFRAGRKIREIEAAIAQVRVEAEKVRGRQLLLRNMERRADEIMSATHKAAEAFAHELQSARKRLYPLGLVSRWVKVMRQFFGGNYFSRRDVAILSPLLQLAERLAQLIDQRVLDDEGKMQ